VNDLLGLIYIELELKNSRYYVNWGLFWCLLLWL